MRSRPPQPAFRDRVDAGRRLGRAVRDADLKHRWRSAGEGDAALGGEPEAAPVVVLGLPRGGVPVAAQVASALGAPLDVLVVRKLGVPSQPELAMGAIGEDGVEVLDRQLMAQAGVTQADLARVEAREQSQLDQRVSRYRRGRPRQALAGRVVVIVDDGLATGATARAACQVARRAGASRVVVAVPVGPADAAAAVTEADRVVVLAAPRPFVAVGQHYADFTPTTDDEVVAILDRAGRDDGP